MSKSRAKSESNIYHVMARGDGRQIVFENDEDRKLFLALLRNRKQQDAPIFAWCLMDNHFHLVIQASLPVLSLMMQQIMSQYATSFNTRHQHTGHIFNQRFKSEPINDDSYFLTGRQIRASKPNQSRHNQDLLLPMEQLWRIYRRPTHCFDSTHS